MANFKYNKSAKKDNYMIIFLLCHIYNISFTIFRVISYRLNIFSISVSLSIFKYVVYLAIFTSIISLVSLGYSFKRQSKMLAVLFLSLHF